MSLPSPIMCTNCNQRVSTMQRLETHLMAKHNFKMDTEAMRLAKRAAQQLACPLWRVSTDGRVRLLMAGFGAVDEDMFKIVKYVLYHHNVLIEGGDGDDDECMDIDENVPHVVPKRSDRVCVNANVNKSVLVVKEKIPFKSQLQTKNLACGRGSRSLVTKSLKSSHLIKHFSTAKLCKIVKEYGEAARDSRQPRSVTRTCQYVHRYIQFVKYMHANKDTASEWRMLLCGDFIDQYLIQLKSVFRPLTVKNHCMEVCKFLRDAKNLPKFNALVPIHWKGDPLTKASALWEVHLKSVQKAGKDFQRTRVLGGQVKVVSFLPIFEYLHDKEVLISLVVSFNRLEDILSKESINSATLGVESIYIDSWLKIVRYLVASVLPQGQRLCVFQNLKISEYDRAKQMGSFFIVRVSKHKTQAIYGDACFVLPLTLKETWDRYRRIRNFVAPSSPDAPFFVNSSGSELTGGSIEDLNSYLRKRGHFEISHSDVRKSVETLSTLYQADYGRSASGNALISTVQHFLCHSDRVVQSHYAFRTDEVVAQQARIVERIVAQNVMLTALLGNCQDYLPNGGKGENFPIKIKLLQIFQKRHTLFGLLVNDMSDYNYHEIVLKWTQANLESVVDALRTELVAIVGVNTCTEEVTTSARHLVSDLPNIWNAMKPHILIKILSGYV